MDLRASFPVRLFSWRESGTAPQDLTGTGGGAADLLGRWSRRGALSASTKRMVSDAGFKTWPHRSLAV